MSTDAYECAEDIWINLAVSSVTRYLPPAATLPDPLTHLIHLYSYTTILLSMPDSAFVHTTFLLLLFFTLLDKWELNAV